MDIRTYRARSIQEALRLIRDDLGPDASVLHTREVSGGMLGLFGSRQIEVTASNEVNVPSRLPEPVNAVADDAEEQLVGATADLSSSVQPANANPASDFRARVRQHLLSEDEEVDSPIEAMIRRERTASRLPDAFARAFTQLIDAGVPDELARELLDTVKRRLDQRDWHEPLIVESRLARIVEDELRVRGDIRLAPGRCTVVALVGPTGVGKTTTIAKIAANMRLKEKKSVGLITVDTYRIAAVEQLRTYADIIDLPMEVVSTPREMRAAVERLSHLDLVLIDTAGRSPRDEAQIQELRSMLAEADADEVHLVLSSVTSDHALVRAVERFSAVGATHLVITKVDESAGLGSLLPLLRRCELPLSYITHGQNVPHDIQTAQRRSVARMLLGMEDR